MRSYRTCSIGMVLGLLLAANSWADPAPLFMLKWGSYGTEAGQFLDVRHIATDASGYVYVSDYVSGRIQRFDQFGRFQNQWGIPTPEALAVGNSGIVYVTDTQSNRVLMTDVHGNGLGEIGGPGSGDGQFNGPVDIAVDGNGYIYVADQGNSRVQKFTASGDFVTQWSVPYPRAIATDRAGHVLVLYAFRLYRFDGDGTLLGTWEMPKQVLKAKGIAADAAGNVYVVDAGDSKVLKFTGAGEYLAEWGGEGSGDGQFRTPEWVALGPDECVFVTDNRNYRIQKFGLQNAPTPIGTDVSVVFKDVGISITFDNVVAGGTTYLGTNDKAIVPPTGYYAGTGPTNYSAYTTAQYTGFVHVCIDYNDKWFKEGDGTLGIFQMVDGAWVNQTTSLDVMRNRICGTALPLGIFSLFTATHPYGEVYGKVLASCPESGTPLVGVTVDVYEAKRPDLVASAVTDMAGTYTVDNLTATKGMTYIVHVVTPLSYSTPSEAVTVYLKDRSRVDFPMDCNALAYSPRSIGYWKHQFAVACGGKGKGEIDPVTLCSYLDLIVQHFNSNAINSVVVYQPPSWGGNPEKLQLASDLLNLQGSEEMIARARQQLMALLLNVASGAAGLTREVSKDGATLSQAITYCDRLIDKEADYELAKTIADLINNGKMVAAGVIPLDTENIAYRRGEIAAELSISQNPLQAPARIRYVVPASAASIHLGVYDVMGRCVQTLVSGRQAAGAHTIMWDPAGRNGHPLGTGVYFLRLAADGRVLVRRVAVLR